MSVHEQIERWEADVRTAILAWELAEVPVSGVSTERAHVFREVFRCLEDPPHHPETGQSVYNAAYIKREQLHRTGNLVSAP